MYLKPSEFIEYFSRFNLPDSVYIDLMDRLTEDTDLYLDIVRNDYGLYFCFNKTKGNLTIVRVEKGNEIIMDEDDNIYAEAYGLIRSFSH